VREGVERVLRLDKLVAEVMLDAQNLLFLGLQRVAVPCHFLALLVLPECDGARAALHHRARRLTPQGHSQHFGALFQRHLAQVMLIAAAVRV
jgi:hypothetical protein